MSHRRYNSTGTVPFSWENKPGISKAMTSTISASPDLLQPTHEKSIRLPPPPYRSDSRRNYLAHGLYVPLPPCAFQPPARTSSKREEHDPFLAAMAECTKSVRRPEKVRKKQGWIVRLGFCCKRVFGVREDVLVKV